MAVTLFKLNLGDKKVGDVIILLDFKFSEKHIGFNVMHHTCVFFFIVLKLFTYNIGQINN